MTTYSRFAYVPDFSANKRQERVAASKEDEPVYPLATRWLNKEELAIVRQQVGKVDLIQPESNLIEFLGL